MAYGNHACERAEMMGSSKTYCEFILQANHIVTVCNRSNGELEVRVS